MKVIIPAAGRGTRLQPITNFSPKCLVDVNGNPLLYYLLSQLKQLEVSEVIIVTGYLSNMIEEYVFNRPDFPPVTCLKNDRYESTNSIVSLSLTTHLWDTDICIIDSDLSVRPNLLAKLTQCKDTCLVIDNSKPVDQIDMKASVKDGRFIYMDKTLLRKDTFGEFFGLSRWTPDAAKAFASIIDDYLARGETSVWYEYAIRELAKDYCLPVLTCSSEMWIEIDNINDYEKAKQFLDWE